MSAGAAVIVPDREPCLCGRDHSDLKRCAHGIRHWFTVWGAVGLRRPTCGRCGAPNPNWTAEMQREWEAFNGGPGMRAAQEWRR